MASSFPATHPARQRNLSVRCPAKINLHLRVGPVREDGFHPLLSWMCTVGLFDNLELNAATAGSPLVTLRCDDPSLPTDERNLVVRIARAWGEALQKSRDREGLVLPEDAGRPLADARGSLPPIAGTLAKRIPAGAGLGGGSSDGACALLAADRFWTGGRRDDGTPRPAEDLSAFAARFGSDVPFFLAAPGAVCSGRGEIVRKTAAPAAARWTLLVLPDVHMPTPEVYSRFDAMGLGRQVDIEEQIDWTAWSQLPAMELLPRLVNDLEPPAFAIRPDLGDLGRNLQETLGRIVRMSGSGSSLFTLFDRREEAEEARERVRRVNEAIRLEVVEMAPAIEVR